VYERTILFSKEYLQVSSRLPLYIGVSDPLYLPSMPGLFMHLFMRKNGVGRHSLNSHNHSVLPEM
jgi:hypothetical protein